jgi:Holliday junction resolvase-like predicted endonuclease
MSPEEVLAAMKTAKRAKGVRKPGVMNRGESDYAALLEVRRRANDIVWYAFEAITFKLAKDLRYTPDFMVMRVSGEIECHEIKGRKNVDGQPRAYVTEDARIKIVMAAELFPFRFIQAFPLPGGQWSLKEF